MNPRAGHPTYSLSRGAPSPLGYFSVYSIEVETMWRREWDSNPRLFRVTGFQDRLLKPLGHLSMQAKTFATVIITHLRKIVNCYFGILFAQSQKVSILPPKPPHRFARFAKRQARRRFGPCAPPADAAFYIFRKNFFQFFRKTINSLFPLLCKTPNLCYNIDAAGQIIEQEVRT